MIILPIERVYVVKVIPSWFNIFIATAPAATLMVVRQYKAKGPLTSLLLPIVALDDAVGLVVFAVSFGIAKTLVSGTVDMVSILVNPFIEIIASLLLGAVMGWILTQLEKMFNSNTNRLNMTIAFVFLTTSLSMLDFHVGPLHISFSSLLVCMMLGTVFCNECDFSEELMDRIDRWSSPLLILFFVISGAELELSVFTDYIIVVIATNGIGNDEGTTLGIHGYGGVRCYLKLYLLLWSILRLTRHSKERHRSKHHKNKASHIKIYV